MQPVNFNHLYNFYVIASHESLTQAAKQLGVSKATLSEQLKALEDMLTTPLFLREGGRLELNHDGKYLFDHAKEMFKISEKMMSGFPYRKTIKGVTNISIGITPLSSSNYAATLLSPLLENKEYGVKVHSAQFDTLIQDLYSHKIDFIVSETNPDYLKLKGIEFFHMDSPKYYFVSSKKNILDGEKFPNLLQHIPFFKYNSSFMLQRDIQEYLYKNSIFPSIIGETDDVMMMLKATEAGKCFAVLPEYLIQRQLERGELVALGEFKASSTKVNIIYNSEEEKEELKSVLNLLRSPHLS